MKFLVLELQHNEDNVATLINQYDSLKEAQSAYYTILSYAAVSEIEHHAAMIINEEGAVYYNESFAHPKPEPEPVPEPEEEPIEE